ncbi:MAG: hypothetical protein WDN30_07730 [Pararobbsia sp.]
MKKADYARMHGWHRSYVSKLHRERRVVLSSDGKLVDWAATDQLIGETSDPSKLGVANRWSAHRQERDVHAELLWPAAAAAATVTAVASASVSAGGVPVHERSGDG